MTIQIVGTTVEVLGKTYQLKCPEQQVAALQKAAQYLEEKMKEVREVAHVLSMDRIAVLAALNIAHKLLTLEHENYLFSQMTNERLQKLHNKIEGSLSYRDQLELNPAE